MVSMFIHVRYSRLCPNQILEYIIVIVVKIIKEDKYYILLGFLSKFGKK